MLFGLVSTSLPEQKWSLNGVELEDFRQAALGRRAVLRDAERELNAALEAKKKACKAIAKWEEGIPSEKVRNAVRYGPDHSVALWYSTTGRADTNTARGRTWYLTVACSWSLLPFAFAGLHEARLV